MSLRNIEVRAIKILRFYTWDFFLFVALKLIQKESFRILYRVGVFRIFFRENYTHPQQQNLSALYESEITNSLTELETIVKDSLEKNLESSQEVSSLGEVDLRKKISQVVLIHPDGWLTEETAEGRTQGQQIRFFKAGIEALGIGINCISDNQVDIRDVKIRNSVIILFSLSKLQLTKNVMCEIMELRRNREDFKTLVVGYNTMYLHNDNISLITRWCGYLDAILHFEEKFELLAELRRHFIVLHIPAFGYESRAKVDLDGCQKYQIHASALIKHNRAAWFLTTRYLCEKENMVFKMRIISDPLRHLSQKFFGYADIKTIARERAMSSCGLVLAHRAPGEDVFLLSNLLDYYRYGCIPIVQHEKHHDSISSYLIRNLDYFEVQTSKDLHVVLKMIKHNPDLIKKMRTRILKRVETEFSPKVIVNKLLLELRGL